MFDLLLIAILAFGVISSYTDLKFGKIKNIFIIAMIAFAILFNIYSESFTFDLIVNSLIALIFGFLLYYLDYWSEGDAKLFFAFTLLLPISVYHFGKINFFPAISILINIFVPITIFYIFKSLRAVSLKDILKSFLSRSQRKSFFISLLYLFGLPFVFEYFHLGLDIFSSTLIVFILFQVLKRFSQKYTIILFSSLSILNLMFLLIGGSLLNFLFSFIASIFVLQFLVLMYMIVSKISFSAPVSVMKLKSGQILGEPLFYDNKTFTKKLKRNGIKIVRLTEKEISALRKLSISKKLGFKTLLIEKTIPFAPFVFIGVLLTYILGGNLFSFVYLKYIKYAILQI